MLVANNWRRRIKSRTLILFGMAIAIFFSVVSCSSGQQATGGIDPAMVVDYIHQVAEADRTAYTKHVINRLEKLEGQDKPDGVVPAEATESWKESNGIPLPAQMFRMGAELASEGGNFTIGLISPWNINDNQAPKGDFETTGMQQVVDSKQPYKAEQELGGKKYFSAIYPDIAVAEACVTCHNNHPIHKERYPDKIFKLGDVMGGVVINLPLGS